MTDYLRELNKEQLEAATYTEGPLLILAGAGSGKTKTMTHRMAYLIDQGISPYSILAVTFTNKAAKEMRDRLEALCGHFPGIWVQTFHSACLRILRAESDAIGYGSNFAVYDTQDQKSAVKSILKDFSLDEKKYTPSYVIAHISDAKERGLSADEYAKQYTATPDRKVVAAVYAEYEKMLRKNNAMDFDDLILNTVRLFISHEEILLKYCEKFRYIMVDEYQDTNMLQYRLVKQLSSVHKNICVVGDDDQCIYQWRGADIRNILEFEKDFPGTKIVKLEKNYRSTSNIINAAHSVIVKNERRKNKQMKTDAAEGEKIEYYRADTDKEEGRWTAEKILSLMRNDDSLRYSDFAILYRTNVQSRRFEEQLSIKDIPYQVLSGQKFYERKEIKDMMSYMRLAVNPDDDLALLRVLNEPRRGIGQKSEDSIKAYARMKSISVFDALKDPDILSGLSEKQRNAVGSFTSMYESLAVEKERMSVAEVYDILLDRSGYLKVLQDQNTVESESRIENLLEFKTVILEKEKEAEAAGENLTLENFLEDLALIADIDNHDKSLDAVSLMTLHSAKGLEFEVVFMPGMETGLFPSYRSLDSADGIEEERRLCYVGMTRAKKRLFMSSSEIRMMYGRTETTAESQFLKEIDRKYLTGHALFTKRTSSFDGYNVSRPMSSEKYVSPIEMLRQQRAAAPKETLEGVAVNVGDRVEHTKFGIGVVVGADGNILSVRFDEGVKKLAKDMAPLKMVE